MPSRICPASFSRSWCWVALIGVATWAPGAWAETTSATLPDIASNSPDALFSEAVAQFKAKDFEHALALFTRVTELKDSPNVRLYIGYCYKELGNDEEAHRAFVLTIKQALESENPKYAQTREAAHEQLSVLSLRLAKLTISVVETVNSFEISLDDHPLDPTQLGSPIVLGPGTHHVVALAKGTPPVIRDVELKKGDNKTITLLFERPSERRPSAPPVVRAAGKTTTKTSGQPWMTYGFAAGGLGLVGLGVFAVAGYQTRSTFDQLRAECSRGCSDIDHRNSINSGKTYQTVANVALAIGAAGALASATLFYIGFSSKGRAKSSVELTASAAGISCQGRF